MALAAITDAVEAKAGPASPDWHRWQSPADGRCWAARTTVPARPLSAAMIVSADSDDELDEKLANAEPAANR